MLVYLVITIALFIALIVVSNSDKIYWWPYMIHYAFIQLFTMINIAYDLSRSAKRVENWKREYFVMRALNKVELEELFNDQMVRQNKQGFDEKESLKLAEKIL